MQTPPSSPYVLVEWVDTKQFERMTQSLAAAQEVAAAAQAELEALKTEAASARKLQRMSNNEISEQSPQQNDPTAGVGGSPTSLPLEAGATMAAAVLVLVLAVKELAIGRR